MRLWERVGQGSPRIIFFFCKEKLWVVVFFKENREKIERKEVLKSAIAMEDNGEGNGLLRKG